MDSSFFSIFIESSFQFTRPSSRRLSFFNGKKRLFLRSILNVKPTMRDKNHDESIFPSIALMCHNHAGKSLSS